MNLNQVAVPSVNLDRSVKFYTKLGMRLIVDALPHYVRFELPDGDATFSVHLADEEAGTSGTMVYFESDRLDAWVSELEALGIHMDEAPEDRRWKWREARLRDPDGNWLVLYHAGENRKNPPWRVGLDDR